MMKPRRIGAVGALLVLLLGAGALAAKLGKGDTVTVRAVNARLMAAPKYIAKVVGEADRGEHLTVESTGSGWLKVSKRGGQSGWIDQRNVVESKVELSRRPGGDSVRVSQAEVELAGRGFTPEVERKYKSGKPNLRFNEVDRIEKTALDPSVLADFAASGKLGGEP